MGSNLTEREHEEKRLKETITLAEAQLEYAKDAIEKKKSEIIVTEYECQNESDCIRVCKQECSPYRYICQKDWNLMPS